MTTAYSAVDPSTPFEQGGEEPAGLQFGNLYFDIADGRRRSWYGARCGGGAGVGPFLASGAEFVGGFDFDQILQADADQFGETRWRCRCR